MKRFYGIIFLLLLAAFSSQNKLFAAVTKQKTDRLELLFFGSPTCGECQEIKMMLFKPLEIKYPDKLKIHIYDIDDSTGFSLQIQMEKLFAVTNSSPQELYFPDTVLIGYDDIMKSGQALIEKYLQNPDSWYTIVEQSSDDSLSYKETLKQRFSQFSFLSIIAAGMIDGINPCAIATMIFLISFLAVRKKSRGEILIIGACFTAAVFTTYLLLGVGAFKALTALKSYYFLSRLIKWLAVSFAGVVALVSFIDAFRFKKSGDTKDILNQLPKPVKLRIHRIISGNLSGGQLVAGSIITGFLVTLLEAVCTGQVYIPTIILMTRQSDLRIVGWLYLILYNILFVLPLITVMILSYYGMRWDRLAKATQSHLTLMKVLFGIVLTALALFLALAG